MTQDEIIRSPLGREQLVALAREAGFAEGVAEIVGLEGFKRFAALVAAHEREACAKVCEQLGALNTATPQKIATAIRARGDHG